MKSFSLLFIGATLLGHVAHAENVEIYLLDMLDNSQNGYCIDIARAGRERKPGGWLAGTHLLEPSWGIDGGSDF